MTGDWLLGATVPAHPDDLNSWLTFPGDPEHGMPVLARYDGPLPSEWLPFPGVDEGAGTHFFVVDERFERVFRSPARHAERLSRAGLVLSPDFSVWREMPEPMLRWQTYRNRWCGALWQALGIAVVPTVGWASDPESFFFAGLPRRATVAVASIGLGDAEGRLLFERGLAAMEEALDPDRVLVYGGLRWGRLSRAEVTEVPYSHWAPRRGRVLDGIVGDAEAKVLRAQGGRVKNGR